MEGFPRGGGPARGIVGSEGIVGKGREGKGRGQALVELIDGDVKMASLESGWREWESGIQACCRSCW